MAYTTSTQNLYKENLEDVYFYTSSLFSSQDKEILQSDITPIQRIKKLNEITQEIKTSDSIVTTNIIKIIRKKYLLKILQDLVNIRHIDSLKKDNLKDKLVSFINEEITYIDSRPLKKKDGNFLFNISYLSKNYGPDEKRKFLIKDFFSNNCKTYINSYKEKLIAGGKLLYRYLLYIESKELNDEQLENLITFLVIQPEGISYVEKDIADNTFEPLINNKKIFNHSLGLLQAKIQKNETTYSSLSEDDKTILKTFFYLKTSPKESKKLIKKLEEKKEREKLFAEVKPNILLLQLYSLEEDISKLVNVKYDPKIKISKLDFIFDLQFFNSLELCNKVREKVLNICREAFREETKAVKTIKSSLIVNHTLKFTKKAASIFSIVIFLFVIKFYHYYFYDIESIYKNKFFNESKISLESIPYPPELKDTLNPSQNELRQKQRLDYIRDLNTRYFKILTLLLNPVLDDDLLHVDSIEQILPSELKDIQNIKAVKEPLSKIININEWQNIYEPLFGVNILTEYNAYGAIVNFLCPPLSYHIVKDLSGKPIEKNGKLEMYAPLPEKEMLKRDLIQRFSKEPLSQDIEPKNYINKHDTNYKKIKTACNKLFAKIQKLKNITIKRYRESTKQEEKEQLKTLLKAISLIEVRIKDLNIKIQKRYLQIVKNNTYRLEVE